MTHDICCLGHITHDKITTPAGSVHMPGGTSFYFAHALASLEAPSFLLVASLGASDLKAVAQLRARGVEVEVVPSARTVYFENIYGDDPNIRTQKVRAKADAFTIADIPSDPASIYHLGTLLADDFPPEVVKSLSELGRVSVDAQGFLRRVEGEDVKPCDWADKLELLPYIDILKANEHEMVSLTGLEKPREAARRLADWGVKEVVLTLGDRGSLILADGCFYDIPAYAPEKVVDATGCGDTYMAGYLYRRSQGASPDEAGRFAAAMCTIKLQHSGPFMASEADVKALVATKA